MFIKCYSIYIFETNILEDCSGMLINYLLVYLYTTMQCPGCFLGDEEPRSDKEIVGTAA